MKFNKNATFY